MYRSSGVLFTLLGACLVGAGCGGSGGSAALPGSDPRAGIYAGTILDEDGLPVAGAVVTVEGIEASTLTGPDGSWYLEDPALATLPAGGMVAGAMAMALADAPGDDGVRITVLAPGYEPRVATLLVSTGQRADVDLVRSALEPRLVVSSPTGEKPFLVPTGCGSPRVLFEGFARLTPTPSLRLDVVIALDRSGSTGKEALDVDGDGVPESVLEVERAAARSFVAGLDGSITRVALVAFEDSAQVVSEFTADLEDVASRLETVGPPDHGTNYEAAFRLAKDLFLERAAADEAEFVPAEAGQSPPPEPFRAVVLLSDGIPTSHGVPRVRSDSNLTQSRLDRVRSIDAAGELGSETGAQLFAYSILPARDTNRTRTTLPACVAACGGGRYENVSDLAMLVDRLAGQPLQQVLSVEIENLTTGAEPIAASLWPDGFFSELVPVRLDVDEFVANPSLKINRIAVRVSAFEGSARKTTEQVIALRLISEDDVLGGTGNLAGAQSATEGVLEVPLLEKPTGGGLGDTGLHDFLKSEFEDAVELKGVETFRLLDPEEGGADAIRVDFVYKQACYKSDFGYAFIDPQDPPRSAAEALQDVTQDQILVNSGDVGTSNCDLQSIEAGAVSREIRVPSGGALVFFILPNRTLADYRKHPKKGLAPLFTMSSLNPGGFDQALTFRSVRGRTEAGASLEVVSEGPMAVFAFEDASIASQSDQDFSDIVFTVTSVQGRVDSLECD